MVSYFENKTLISAIDTVLDYNANKILVLDTKKRSEAIVNHFKSLVFNNCRITMLSFYLTPIKDVEIKDSIIGEDAFRNSQLEKIVLDNCQISLRAFMGCRFLKEVIIKNCDFIPEFTFRDCVKLEEISLCVKGLDQGVFMDCCNLKRVNLIVKKYIGDDVFRNCKSLREVNIVNSQKITWGERVFFNCYDVKVMNSIEIIQKAFRKYRYDPQYSFCQKIQIGNLKKLESFN